MNPAQPANIISNTDPYVGLRPFEFHEAPLFFGRGEDIAEMLGVLRRDFFLAVIGSSGSGKSSLARAGLLPAIEADFLDGPGWDWRFVVMRPGRSPFQNLATALVSAARPERADDPDEVAFRRLTLQSGPRGLLEAVDELLLPPNARLIVLVDQFEEIFRFLDRGRWNALKDEQANQVQRNEALAFVDMLLTTAAQRDRRVFILLTMRSEYLGDCEAFLNLPAAISKSQYLTRRLTREQLRDTIERPIKRMGGRFDPHVVASLLNAVGSAMDQLPRLEHVLLRMWKQAVSEAGANATDLTLTPLQYDLVGGFENALNLHADEIYDDLEDGGTEPSKKQRITERMFRCLSERTGEGRLIRRLTTVGEVAGVADVSPTEVIEVVDVFIESGCNFLIATPAGRMNAETTLDISHESLQRQWKRLRKWIEAEADSATMFRRILDAAQRHSRGEAAPWVPPDLDLAMKWLTRQKPTSAWAARYVGGSSADVHKEFAACMDFIAKSDTEWKEDLAKEIQAREERERMLKERADSEKQRADDARQAQARQTTLTKRFLSASIVASVLAVLAIIGFGIAMVYGKRAKAAEARARKAEAVANANAYREFVSAAQANQMRVELNYQRNTLITLSKLRPSSDPKESDVTFRSLGNASERPPYSGIGMIAFQMGQQDMLGTGTLIGPDTVLTSALNVYDRKLKKNTIGTMKVFPGGVNSKSNQPLDSSDVVAVRYSPEWKKSENVGHALAILKLKRPFPRLAGSIETAFVTDQELAKTKIEMIGFPADRDFGSMWSIQGKIKLVKPDRLLYSIAVSPGMGGAPVLLPNEANKLRIVGVHVGKDDDSEAAVRLTRENWELLQKTPWETPDPPPPPPKKYAAR